MYFFFGIALKQSQPVAIFLLEKVRRRKKKHEEKLKNYFF